MGNCQAVDNASFVLQTQSGRAERFYAPISAAEIMKLHPGHYVALLLATTFYSSPPSSSSSGHHQPPPNNNPTTTNQNLRVTRIKLLRPTDNLVLGHAYRLITTQEVMKGLNAKKNRKLNNFKNFQLPESTGKSETKSNCETRSNQLGKIHHQMRKTDKHRAPTSSKSYGSKPRGWHPSLNSISEATS
ncbi:hypothetical protein HanRHA438_Chr16g0742991 [Helianthus annuus]|nr:hypothetical protein HanIR_Chr16g0794481 [Helianthus annuus]KAJ0459187.1 hypothetical protein HanHA89_Chr16g0646051 [Helianthus annuus]KAJ0639743.1 hypothetical protein HanLR1_Chr16g0607181 [Helianthus annuus]KAJ0643686.1 hypothetical protein HanOQP8_Chr16g0603311 [Helianthus annuus]KAJ0819822.1 hypothetical protein HanPSC8_Chr16g0700521 [Helianthus annuus]